LKLKAKIIFATLLIGIIVGGISSSSVQAQPVWKVNGVSIPPGGQDLVRTNAASTVFGHSFWIYATNGNLLEEVHCTSLVDAETLMPWGRDVLTEIEWTGCTRRFHTPACPVANIQGTGFRWRSFLSLPVGPSYRDTLLHLNVPMHEYSNTCEVTGKYEIVGNLAGEWDGETQELIFPSNQVKGTSLTAGEDKVQIKGNDQFKIEKGEKIEIAEEAIAGPFWHSRAKGTKGSGVKIEEKEPENFAGEGGSQTLKGEVAATPIEIAAKSIQTKGIIYNNTLQGQIKTQTIYTEPKLVKPEIKGCETKLGTANTIKSEGHLAWKWDNERPSLIYTPGPIKTGTAGLPQGSFMSVTFGACGVLTGKFIVEGNLSTMLKPVSWEEWGSTVAISSPGWTEQDVWNGEELLNVEPSLTFGGRTAALVGENQIKPATQEVAIFSK
jgi:hypothetical protein